MKLWKNTYGKCKCGLLIHNRKAKKCLTCIKEDIEKQRRFPRGGVDPVSYEEGRPIWKKDV